MQYKQFAIAMILFFSVNVNAFEIKPFKDELYSHSKRKIIESKNGGSFRKYAWDYHQDVVGRDAVTGEKAKAERIDLSVLKDQKDTVIQYPGGSMETYEVGNPDNAEFALIYIHGANGSKELGGNDYSFGGNFNRAKNLAARNNGVYYSPSVTFDSEGNRGVTELIKSIKKKSPKAKIAIACGSAGAYTCWSMYNAKETGGLLSGMIFVGGAGTDLDLQSSEGFKNKVPVIISHGSKDPLVPWKEYEQQYEAFLKADPKFPVRFELYDGGKHGTPMRMIDWKESMEWAFSKSATAVTANSAVSKPPATGAQ